mgnify:CR=1 FL=1
MTALKDFERLECLGVWRASDDAQRLDVIVSLGDASLTISDQNETAIAHWSLPAVERINPGKRPALYRPGDDATEMLEISDETLIRAIKRVQAAIEKRRPHPGRLRSTVISAIVLILIGLAVFWLPGAMVDYTASVVPESKRKSIGEDLLTNIRRVAGKPCDEELGVQALGQLHDHLLGNDGGRLVILAAGVQTSNHLPGKIVLLNRAIVEDFEGPEVVAGFVLAEDQSAKQQDPLLTLLRSAGLAASFKLLTTGNIPDEALASYSESLLTTNSPPVPEQDLLARFREASVPSSPYAYAIDVSGEETIGLIEADPVPPAQSHQLLKDAEWVSLQGICGE